MTLSNTGNIKYNEYVVKFRPLAPCLRTPLDAAPASMVSRGKEEKRKCETALLISRGCPIDSP